MPKLNWIHHHPRLRQIGMGWMRHQHLQGVEGKTYPGKALVQARHRAVNYGVFAPRSPPVPNLELSGRIKRWSKIFSHYQLSFVPHFPQILGILFVNAHTPSNSINHGKPPSRRRVEVSKIFLGWTS